MARKRFSLNWLIVSTVVALVLVIAVPATRAQGQTQGSEADSKAIKQVYAEWYEAFSRHDAHSAAMTFAEDGDFTNMRGVHNHGRKEIEAHLAMIFAGALGSARRTKSVRKSRPFSPEFAPVDADRS